MPPTYLSKSCRRHCGMILKPVVVRGMTPRQQQLPDITRLMLIGTPAESDTCTWSVQIKLIWGPDTEGWNSI